MAIIESVAEGKGAKILTALVIGVILALLIHIGLGGSTMVGPLDVVREISKGDTGGEDPLNSIVWRIRFPRACAAALIGLILGGVGAAFQSLLRNPLAEPYVLGVASGAALGGAAWSVLGLTAVAAGLGQVAFAFLGGLLSLSIVLATGRRQSMESILVSGVVIGSMLSAILSMLVLMSGQDSNQLLRWLLGSTSPMFWERVAVLGVCAFVGLPLLWRQGRKLNAFTLGEESASRLGIDVKRVRQSVLGIGTILMGAVVGIAGIIPFLGLAAPHAARRLVGGDARWLIPSSALSGGILLTLADVLAQRMRPGAELPLGAVTALLGAPVLLALMRRNRLA